MAVIPCTPSKTFLGLRLFAAVTGLLKPCFPKELGSPSVGARENALRRDLDAMDEARRREMAKR
jgi:hypothetical protein